MTSLIAAIRPDSWNFPLLVHIFGATVLVGAVITGVTMALSADRSTDPVYGRRLAFWSFLFVAVPAWFVMRVGAEWIRSKEFDDVDDEPGWIGLGYATSEIGGILLLVAVVLAGLASRRSQSGLGKASGYVAAVALVGWLVAVWAMGAKPD
jgi:hypothetical protein